MPSLPERETYFIELRLIFDGAPDQKDAIVLAEHSRSYGDLEVATSDLVVLEKMWEAVGDHEAQIARRQIELERILARLGK